MKRRLLLHFSYLTVSKYGAEALFVLRGLVIARLLGPGAFGVWSAMRLILVFSRFAHLGSNSGMLQSAPDAEGAGDLLRADDHRRVASAASLAGAVVVAVVVGVVFGGWAPAGGVRWWWWLVALIVVLQQLMLFYRDALASQRRFGWSAVSIVGFAAASTAAGIGGALAYGLGGFLVGLALAHGAVILACSLAGPTFPLPAWRLRHAAQLMNIGWPIVAGQVLFILLWNVDKLTLWVWRGNEELGIYSVQGYFTAAVMLLPAAVATVFHPHLRVQLGATGNPRTAQPYLLQGTEVLAHTALPVIGLGFLLLHLPIRWLIPEYVRAIPPGRLLMLLSFFSILASVAIAVLLALSRQRQLLAIRAVCVVVSLGAAAAALQSGAGLVTLAAAASLGLVVHALATMVAAMRGAQVSAAAMWAHLAVLMVPYAALAAVLPALFVLIPDTPGGLLEDVALSAARCAILMVLAAPLLWRAWRKLGLQPLRGAAAQGVATP